MKASVIIPTLNAGSRFKELLEKLAGEVEGGCETIVIDSGSTDGTVSLARRHGARLIQIDKSDFNHGGTRNAAARIASGAALAFLTQDVVPLAGFLERLLKPLGNGTAEAAYARQVAAPSATPRERFTRLFNYPNRSTVRDISSVADLGIKAFFFSNAASAVRADAFWRLGGFREDVLINEDIYFCADLLRFGGRVAYVADARVVHSHDYRPVQLLQRYFDMGAATRAGSSDVFRGVKSGGQGMRFALAQLRYLWHEREWQSMPLSLVETAAKAVGFYAGFHYRLLPPEVRLRMSMHPHVWRQTIPRRATLP
jgi:rhamnosyltransferase